MHDLLKILACPACKGELSWTQDKAHLLCQQCRMKFPIREGIPVLLLNEAVQFEGGNEDTE